MNASPIDFWFDFTSPYSYLMSEKIDEVAKRYGRSVRWRPILLAPIFKAVGGRALTDIPLKGDYSRHDFLRSARFLGVPYLPPDVFPVAMLAPARAFYFLQEHKQSLTIPFAHAVFRAYFTHNRRVDEPDTLMAVAEECGIDAITRALIPSAISDERYKLALRAATDAAIAEGVFGAPFITINGEAFWGVDRLPQIEWWLSQTQL